MEQDKYISLGDSYIDWVKQGDDTEVTQFIDDVLNGKIKLELFTKPLPKIHEQIHDKE